MEQHSAGNTHDNHGAHGSHDEHENHGSFKSYVIGFLISIVLTIIPIVIVLNDLMKGTPAILVLMGAALLQFVVQLIYFMHLKEEKKPRYNLIVLIFGLAIVLTIVAGSMWIMMYNKVA